jgi:hypothetical protein
MDDVKMEEETLQTFIAELTKLEVPEKGVVVIKTKSIVHPCQMKNIMEILKEKTGFRGMIFVIKEEDTIEISRENPLSNIISDEQFRLLNEQSVFNKNRLRDISIKCQYQALRAKKISANDCIDQIQKSYTYIQHETIRKIVMKGNKNEA